MHERLFCVHSVYRTCEPIVPVQSGFQAGMRRGYRNARSGFGEAVSLDEVRRKGIREELLRRLRHASSCSREEHASRQDHGQRL
jgi:hypothetical protein